MCGVERIHHATFPSLFLFRSSASPYNVIYSWLCLGLVLVIYTVIYLADISEPTTDIGHSLVVFNGTVYLTVYWSELDYYTRITMYTAEQQILATTTVYGSLSTTLRLPLEEFSSSYYTVNVTMYNECNQFPQDTFTIYKEGKNLFLVFV